MIHIQNYINLVEQGTIRTCKEQKLLIKYIKKVFETEKLFVDEERVEKYLSYQKYFPFKLFEWEIFCFVLHNCVFDEEGFPRWDELFIMIGRGGGKNGYLSFEDFCLITPTNGIPEYDIDISANSEDQAKTTFKEIYNILENPQFTNKFRKNFYWNLTQITNKKTNSTIRFRTNNPKGKDSLRSGKVDFDEIHAYTDWENINVFTTGLGKKPEPRKTYISTNGDVRDGPLDKLIEKSIKILKGELPDNGFLPFICRLDSEKEVSDPKNWEKANPSLPYLPTLRREMQKEYADYVLDPIMNHAFMTKRMNRPKGRKDTEVTSWENILKTNAPLPDLEGCSCVLGIDYTKTTDFMSAFLLFKKDGKHYGKHHSWLCSQSNDLARIKFPIDEAVERGLLTMVDDVEINPKVITDWIEKQQVKYNIVSIAVDSFRYALLAKFLKEIGFEAKSGKEKGNVKMVRPSDIMLVQPKINSLFLQNEIIWGDDMMMRWFTNNTKLVPEKYGNYSYGKIEPKSRKTDGFMAFVNAVILEDELPEESTPVFFDPIIL